MKNKKRDLIILGIFLVGIASAEQTRITISNTTGDQILATVCKGKSSYLVCWVDNRAGIDTDRIYGQIVSEYGMLEGTEFLITSNPGISKPIVTFNPTNNSFLVTNFGWDKGFFVPENGQSIDSTDVWMSEDGMHPEAMCFDGNKYFMVFYCTYGANKHKLLGKFFSKDGKSIEDTAITIDELYIPKDISIAFNNSQYFVTWSDAREGNYDIYAQLLSKEGVPLPNDFCISYEEWDESSPEVSSDGIDWFVIWEGDCEVKGRIVSSNGQLMGDSAITIIEDKDSYFPSLSFNGDAYIVSASTIEEFNIVMISPSGRIIYNQCFLEQNEPVYWTDICADKFGYLTVFSTKNAQDYDLYGMFANTGVYEFQDTSIFKIISNPFVGFTRVKGYTGELQIYDILGRKVETAEITNEWTTFGNNLKRGVYFAKPKNNCSVKTFKVVKVQ